MNLVSEKVLRAMMCMTRQCWEAGVAAQALLEIEEYEMLELMVYDMVLRQGSDGRLCCVENPPAVTDSSMCIPAAVAVAQRTGDSKYAEAVEKNIQFLLKDAEHGEDGTLYHMIHTQEVWADSAAYLPYSLALTGHYKEAFGQMKGITRSRLYDEKTGLYLHMWDDAKNDYIRALPWGVGNGWILTGLLRTIMVWSEEEYMEEKALMKKWFDELLETLLKYESENHGFHDILDDDTTFEESETAAMVAYTIYRGVKEGMVEEKYLVRADAIREALLKKIAENGLVLDAASSPSFDRPGTAVECQAHVLMMEKMYEDVLHIRR